MLSIVDVHVVVRPLPRKSTSDPIRVRVGVAVREGTKQSFPPLDSDKVWYLDEDFRSFLIEKCVNLERAAWHCPNKVNCVDARRSLIFFRLGTNHVH